MTLDFSPLFRTAIGFDGWPAWSTPRRSPLRRRPTRPTTSPRRRRQLSPDDGGRRLRRGRPRPHGQGEPADRVRQADGRAAGELLYRGIAGRAFERRFALADHIVVEGADLRNGLLHVALKRVVPEALKPRRHHHRRYRGGAADHCERQQRRRPGGLIAQTTDGQKGGWATSPAFFYVRKKLSAMPLWSCLRAMAASARLISDFSSAM